MIDEARLEIERMFIRQNRILTLKQKYEKCDHEQIKECLKKQIDNLEKIQKEKQSLLLKK